MAEIIQFPGTEGRGHFFAVDAAVWDKICREGSINLPIVYLVLARGTGHDNRTTSWSTNAVEQRTGISRPLAKAAIERLTKSKFLRVDKAGTRPRYHLLPASRKADEPDWIWLPNELIDGARGETPPVELLRQSASLPALQLFIELYQAQSLAYNGGVHWRHLRAAFSREQVGQRGQYVVWGFRFQAEEVFHKSAPFVRGKPVGEKFKDQSSGQTRLVLWDALQILKDAGLAEYVGHVIDADTDEASVIHPYALGETGEPGERDIAASAHRAALGMLTQGQRDWVSENQLCLLPVERHRQSVQIVGLLRLRYRARTAATAQWYDAGKWKEHTNRYRQLTEQSEKNSAS